MFLQVRQFRSGRFRRWSIPILALVTPLPCTAFAQSSADSSSRLSYGLQAAPAAPGRLVDLGGYKLHLWCIGQGSPTVVLVPGASGFSFDWALVQPAVGKMTRVCSCDRGGTAWSDLGPRPRTKTQEAFDLRRALMNASEPGPYVLVGQSMGGDVIRLFAADHPTEVAGLVLVDTGSPDGMTNLNGRVGPTRSFSKGRPIPAPRESLRAADRLTAVGIARIQQAIRKRGQQPSIDPPFDKLPADLQRWRRWALVQPQRFVAIESDYIGEEAERVHGEKHRTPQPLADLPLAVLCRDTTVEKSGDPLHVVHQQEVAQLSRRGVFRVVQGAGHHVHVDHPETVIEAIERVVGEVRKDRTKPAPSGNRER